MTAINNLLGKFLHLSLRERILVILAGVIAAFFLTYGSLRLPQEKRIQQLQTAAEAARNQQQLFAAQLVKLEADQNAGRNPLATQQAEIARWKQQVAAADAFYGERGNDGSDLNTLLEELLKTNTQVSLVSLRTIAPTVFISPNATAKGNQAAAETNALAPTVYRSGVEVSLKGSYADLLTYLRALEQRSTRLFWSDARLDAGTYPQATLRLTIYTLGQDAGASLR